MVRCSQPPRLSTGLASIFLKETICGFKRQMAHKPRPRQRVPLAMILLLVIAVGLGSRSFPLFPTILGKYPGDALWVLMVHFGIMLVRPGIHPRRLAFLALAISWMVELSQLHQAPWINSIRATPIGHLALGSAFHWLDLVAYAIGVSVSFILDTSFFHCRLTESEKGPAEPTGRSL
jgi:hypothetical protein